MLMIYLDNFRGFYKTFVPLKKINFLIGENSTGKSSFLSLIKFIASPKFILDPEFNDDEIELGYFKDIANKKVKDYFEFAIISFEPKEIARKNIVAYAMRFKEKDSKPKLTRYRYISDDKDIIINFNSEQDITLSYNTVDSTDLSNENKILPFFKDWVGKKTENLKVENLDLKHTGLPLVLKALLATNEKLKTGGSSLGIPTPLTTNLTWIAPIRAKPKRIYEQFKDKHTPEGDHMPLILKGLLEKDYLDKSDIKPQLEKFGVESGLWSSIKTKTIGKDTITAPFIINIRINKKEYSLANVGYGVSQILPLIVEILTAKKNNWTAIQQPEVHLHPKAQASFADFILNGFISKKMNFLIETHSEYLVNRFRMGYKKANISTPDAQVLFFEKNASGNKISPIIIDSNGSYGSKQPKAFKEFFINEELNLLEL